MVSVKYHHRHGRGHLHSSHAKPVSVIPSDEYSHYKDTGCSYSPKCIECPLPECIHDIKARKYSRKI